MKPIKTALVLAALIILPILECGAGELPKELVDKVTAIVRKHYPEAKINLTNQIFQASHGTMVFTVHGHEMTGEVQRTPHQEEGPNLKGFLLRISVAEGRYQGQAGVPQTLPGPYYPTYIDAPPMDGGKSHYRISFSYGSRVDDGFKKAVFESLPQRFIKR